MYPFKNRFIAYFPVEYKLRENRGPFLFAVHAAIKTPARP